MSPGSRLAAAQVRDAAPLFAALGDETRLRLIVRLSSRGPESIARLSDEAAVSRQAIRKHLEVLSKAGLARGIRRGREHLWRLEPMRLVRANKYLDEISRQWDDALARLKNIVEG